MANQVRPANKGHGVCSCMSAVMLAERGEAGGYILDTTGSAEAELKATLYLHETEVVGSSTGKVNFIEGVKS